MKLSIITINYNNKVGLQRTIDSVVAQSFSDYEWIVIDGGSSDGSQDILERYSDKFSFWVSEPDKGIYNAINKGISHATGDYVQILNSGDWLFDTDTLEKFFSQQYEGDILYGDAIFLYPDGSRLDKVFPDTVSLNYFKWDVINHQATFFRRYVFEGHPYNEDYLIAGDWAYCFESVCRGLRFVHINQTIVYYDNSGISAQWSERQIREREDILEKYIPPQLKPDMMILDDLHRLHVRRSTSKLFDICIFLCNRWDHFMKRIEKWRH